MNHDGPEYVRDSEGQQRVSFSSRPTVIWIGLAAIGASIAIGQPRKPNRMVFFHIGGQNEPSVFGNDAR